MENGDGRPPSSAQHPCRPGKDLKGEITGEGTLIPHCQPKRDQRAASQEWILSRGFAPGEGTRGACRRGTANTPGAGLCNSPVPGDSGDYCKSSLPGLQFPVSRNGVNHRHLFINNSDLSQSGEDLDRTHLRRTGLFLLGFAGFPAASWLLPGPTDPSNSRLKAQTIHPPAPSPPHGPWPC